jgi:hypothetical protein
LIIKGVLLHQFLWLNIVGSGAFYLGRSGMARKSLEIKVGDRVTENYVVTEVFEDGTFEITCDCGARHIKTRKAILSRRSTGGKYCSKCSNKSRENSVEYKMTYRTVQTQKKDPKMNPVGLLWLCNSLP